MGRWLGAGLVVALLEGCEAKGPEPLVTSRYEPSRVEQPGPVAGTAALVYRDDIVPLGRTGGEVIGSLDVKGERGATEEALNEEARRLAAAHGGSHAVFAWYAEHERLSVDEEANERRAMGQAVADAGAAVGCGFGDRVSCAQRALSPLRPPAPMAFKLETVRRAAYLVVRVPRERWTELPAAMQPDAPRPRAPTKPMKWAQKARVGGPPEWQLVPADE